MQLLQKYEVATSVKQGHFWNNKKFLKVFAHEQNYNEGKNMSFLKIDVFLMCTQV